MPSFDDDFETLQQGAGSHLGLASSVGDTPAPVSLKRATVEPTEPNSETPRYEARRLLGTGGMGEVRLCHDGRIGREVAMKVILPRHASSPQVRGRFLREARVQGQLEHPSIVPVYDLGVDREGAAYFTMKCLRGLTLKAILEAQRSGDAAITQAYSRRRLLTAFSSLCLAVDFAHARGVLHRDLKPANVMLGDFGEVYLLDWGVAKVLDAPISGIDMQGEANSIRTIPGDMLGTLGYMSPEQTQGNPALLDARSDVYSLGAILFEILTLAPLHPRKGRLELLRSTSRGADARASVRAPDREVPPELDAICVKATAREPGERYASARALHEAIEAFLDGARDVELRRDLAAKHAALAEEAVERAMARGAGADARRAALAEVGRALALDAENERASRALSRLLMEPPREVPEPVAREMEATAAARHRLQLRAGAAAESVGCAFAAMMSAAWLGVREWVTFAAILALTGAAAAMKLLAARRIELPHADRYAYTAFLLNVLAVLCLGRGYGPLLFMPLVLVVFTHANTTTHKQVYRGAVVATACAALLAAFGLEASGVLSPSYEFRDGAMVILPRVVNHAPLPTMMALTLSSMFLLVVPAWMMGRLQSALRDAEERSFLQAWQLRQLLPEGTRAATPGASVHEPA